MKRLELIKQLLKPPVFADSEEQYVAEISNIIALTLILFSILSIFNNYLNYNYIWTHIRTICAILIAIVALYFLHRGYSKPIRIIIPLDVLAFLTLLLYEGSGFRDISIIGFPMVIVLAGLLLGRKGPPIFALFCMLALFFVYYGEKVGRVTSVLNTDFVDLINIYLYLAVMAALLRLLIGNLSDSLSQTRQQEKALAQSNRELEKYQTQLEELVDERTRELSETLFDLQSTQEELLEAKDAAERANQAKSDFLSSMSHELRTPLNAILGFSQLMMHNISLHTELRENVGIINRSGEHLLTLINNVLDLSKIEAGHTTLNEKSFDLYRLLDDLEDMFYLKAEQKRLQLLFERTADVPRYVRTDETKVRQVLINLLNNAIKFTEEGGVSVRVSYKSTDSAHSHLLFEVEDTGAGIAPDELDRLFEAFVQTETGKASQEGTGLGLPISRKFVQLMGGDIEVSSQVGRGSIFIFEIRVQIVSENELERQPAKRRVIALEPDQPHYRILVVDDKAINRQLLLKFLQPLGFEVREASNGQEAIQIWQAWQPHLIWMDMRMPVMDGYEATKRIKATTTGQATAITASSKVIALTASTLEEERAITISAGCDGFLRKPFREADMFEMMNKHIGVRYIYEETLATTTPGKSQEGLTPTALATLPNDLINELEQACTYADMMRIDKLIERIRSLDAAVANGLAPLADDFEYGKILALIQEVRGK